MNDNITPFDMWARMNLLGRNVRVGKVSVVNNGVELLYRIDIPKGDAFVTEFYGKGAIYSVEPCTEETARTLAQVIGQPAPISMYELPQEWREGIRLAQAQKVLPATTQQPTPIDPETGREEFDDEDRDDDDDEMEDD